MDSVYSMIILILVPCGVWMKTLPEISEKSSEQNPGNDYQGEAGWERGDVC